MKEIEKPIMPNPSPKEVIRQKLVPQNFFEHSLNTMTPKNQSFQSGRFFAESKHVQYQDDLKQQLALAQKYVRDT